MVQLVAIGRALPFLFPKAFEAGCGEQPLSNNLGNMFCSPAPGANLNLARPFSCLFPRILGESEGKHNATPWPAQRPNKPSAKGPRGKPWKQNSESTLFNQGGCMSHGLSSGLWSGLWSGLRPLTSMDVNGPLTSIDVDRRRRQWTSMAVKATKKLT